jgi:dTDP-4-dehydrorhamnose reductase
MRILIFGGDGMLGHALVRAWRDRHELSVTFRQDAAAYRAETAFSGASALHGIDARNLQDVVGAIAQARPEAVVNAIGIVKQRPTAKESIPSLEINALFPHRLSEVCKAAGARLVHLSTDCVFSGAKGSYREADHADAKDLYGRTKLLGELHEPHCLTLRTSIIGLELSRKKSLVEWFLAQRGPIKGFRRALYTGLTTAEMARAIEHMLLREPDVGGLWHLSSESINKFDLLTRLQARVSLPGVEIHPEDEFACDRSLDSSALMKRIAYRVPTWDAMLDELAAEIRERSRAGDAGRSSGP